MYGMFAGMLSQFFRDAMASGNYPTVVPDAGASTPAPQTPLPTLPVPAVVPYTSSRFLALPAASTGHPIPSSLSSLVGATQPMLGVSGLGISLAAGHTNNARRVRVRDLSATQISQTNAGRVAAAHAHLGGPGPGLQARRRVRGPAVRGAVLHQGPQTTLEKVSSFNPAGVREIRVTNLVQPYQVRLSFLPFIPLDLPYFFLIEAGQEVIFYKTFRAAHQYYLDTNSLSFDYTVSETTSLTSIFQQTANNMRVGTKRYTFGPLPAGPSTRLQHEVLELQALVYVNNAKNRGGGAAHLRREPISANLTLQDLFEPALKNLYAPPLYCVQGDRFILHSIVRYPGLTFIETAENAWPRRHSCLTKRHNLQFNESFEMDWGDISDSASDTSGGVPESDSEDDDENLPERLHRCNWSVVPDRLAFIPTSHVVLGSDGSPFLAPDAALNDPIQVSFVLPNDPHYSDSAINSIAHMQQGTLSFRSCSRVTRIPMSKLVELHQASSSDAFEEEVNSWFFLEILNAIGKISLM
ncbi:hypothetical protein K438DRAFT_1978936 [Mycena galopus ATCC 62051]|nr:hypothetical protein K438DRAFT_1978936 [Mycena galopus ATCC 62051]